MAPPKDTSNGNNHKEALSFSGIVTDVRTFQDTVYLFVKCSAPAKVEGRIVRFRLDKDNCYFLSLAAGINIGAEVRIDRFRKFLGNTGPSRFWYKVDAWQDAISADIVDYIA